MSAATDEELDERLWAEIRLQALPRSPREAREQGAKFYYTGKPCPKGHTAERRVWDRTCMGCQMGYQATYRAKHRERIRAINHRYRENHREELSFKQKLYSVYGTCKA